MELTVVNANTTCKQLGIRSTTECSLRRQIASRLFIFDSVWRPTYSIAERTIISDSSTVSVTQLAEHLLCHKNRTAKRWHWNWFNFSRYSKCTTRIFKKWNWFSRRVFLKDEAMPNSERKFCLYSCTSRRNNKVCAMSSLSNLLRPNMLGEVVEDSPNLDGQCFAVFFLRKE